MEKRKQIRHIPDKMAIEFRRMWRDGVKTSEIRERFGVTRSQMQTIRVKLGLPRHPEYCSGKWKLRYGADIRQKCVELRETGLTNRQVGEVLGIAHKTVSALIHDNRRYRPVEEIAPVAAPSTVLAEREYRLALAPRDLTAALFGDPLPGYSALERRA